jgi:hypothetical protein
MNSALLTLLPELSTGLEASLAVRSMKYCILRTLAPATTL